MGNNTIFVGSFIIRSNDHVRTAVARANGNRNAYLTKAEAQSLPADLRDNFKNYRASRGNGAVSAEQFSADYVKYVAREAREADLNHDEILTRREARQLPADLQDNFESVLAPRDPR